MGGGREGVEETDLSRAWLRSVVVMMMIVLIVKEEKRKIEDGASLPSTIYHKIYLSSILSSQKGKRRKREGRREDERREIKESTGFSLHQLLSHVCNFIQLSINQRMYRP